MIVLPIRTFVYESVYEFVSAKGLLMQASEALNMWKHLATDAHGLMSPIA